MYEYCVILCYSQPYKTQICDDDVVLKRLEDGKMDVLLLRVRVYWNNGDVANPNKFPLV